MTRVLLDTLDVLAVVIGCYFARSGRPGVTPKNPAFACATDSTDVLTTEMDIAVADGFDEGVNVSNRPLWSANPVKR
jgi:hypothetical protein